MIKNSVFRPQVRSGDAFEMEWLQTLGIKLFASAGMSVSMSVPMSKIKSFVLFYWCTGWWCLILCDVCSGALDS